MPGFTLILLAGSLSFGGPRREPSADRWLGRDKLYHLAASAVIQSTAHSVLRANGRGYRDAAWTAAGITMSVGVAKELWDRHSGRDVSLKDLVADGAGIGTGAVLIRQLAP